MIDDNNFTKKEWEVLRHLTLGKNNEEIGKELSIGTFTVKVHLAYIFKKLGIKNNN